MPSGHGPSRGNTTPGWVTDDDGRRPASTRAASGRRCRRTRSAGPQPAFCDLEEHNALTAHQERQRLVPGEPRPRGDRPVANEAYRAVFLRVHPTGKMVLSLTTELRRQGARVRAARRRASSACRRSTSRSCRRTPTASASVTASTRARRTARRRRSPARPRRSATRRSCSPAWRWRRRPETLDLVNGAWVDGDGSDPTQVKTIEDIALYAHGTGELPPGVEGGLDAQTVYSD